MTINKLKNNENFNISEGNVKDDNIFPNDNVKKSHNVANNIAQRNSQDNELMKKIFPHKEIIEGESVLVFPYIEEATPLKDVPQEVVSHMEKTIDHISQEGKKVSLTEQWKRGELPKGYYYVEDDGEELIIHIQGQNGSVMGDDFDLKATDWIKPIAPVPSYEEWKSAYECLLMENELVLTLKELLKEWMHFYPIILYEHEDTLKTKDIVELYDKTREVLK